MIFDLDGVLVNSMPSHSQSWVEAFWNVAKVRIERRTLYVLEGMRGVELTEKILAEHDCDLSLVKKVIEEKDHLFKHLERPKAFE
ncbi:MAG: HAD family phosphatase, partial [Nitrososphaera sp.]